MIVSKTVQTWVLLILAAICAGSARSQDAGESDWQKAAGGKMEFEVASVRLHKPGVVMHSNLILTADNYYAPDGGLIITSGPLQRFVQFAYKLQLTVDQQADVFGHLPGWTTTDNFTLEARAPVNATKDQIRLMVRSLLKDRFGLKVHFETRQTAVLVMTLIHPGKPGPKLIPHSEGPACDKAIPIPPNGAVPTVYPLHCDVFNVFFDGQHPGMLGSRNTTLDLVALNLPQLGNLGRPVVDRTGLTGRYDFTLMFAPDPEVTQLPPDSPALQAPSFVEAMKEQLGMRLDAAKLPIPTLVIDHVERPSEN